MAPISSIQPKYPIVQQPTYNAVKIDVNNAQVNAPGYVQEQYSNSCPCPDCCPVYSYPEAPIYEVPEKSVYEPKKEEKNTETATKKETPVIPPPVVVPAETPPNSVLPSKNIDATPKAQETAEAKKVEVIAPETVSPNVDINAFISKLNSSDFEVQSKAMASMINMVQTTPSKATQLLDVRIIDTLLNVVNKDTKTMEGPTAQQLQIRQNILSGKPVTQEEMAEANKITPMEKAEFNKINAIATMVTLQNLYISEVQKMSNNVVPLTELPGAAGIVEQLKNNQNPMVRTASINALSLLQRPEYKNDLTTLFTVAKNDKDPNVQNAANKALEQLQTVK